jgi:mannose-6-phosphate isomerase-like protein (cupin superfamily)
MVNLPGTVICDDDVEASSGRDNITERTLITGEHYAEPMIHRSLHVTEGTSELRVDPAHDEYLYVLAGDLDITIDGEQVPASAGTACQIIAGETWQVTVSSGSAHVLSFLVPAPVTPWANALAKPVDRVEHVAHLGAQVQQAATADRQFEVLFNRDRGSRGATMFVGFIPTSGAPEHYHLYDEICVIVRGSGILYTRGIQQDFAVGSAFHVPPRLLHALENPHPEDLWLLGVFRPEGSAAAAYYPDGRPAPNNED